MSVAQKLFQHVNIAVSLHVECCLCEATNTVERTDKEDPRPIAYAMDFSIFLEGAGWTSNGEGAVCPRCSERSKTQDDVEKINPACDADFGDDYYEV